MTATVKDQKTGIKRDSERGKNREVTDQKTEAERETMKEVETDKRKRDRGKSGDSAIQVEGESSARLEP